jgi:hypothetical protein
MAAIISEKFRIFNAKQFLESFSEGSSLSEESSDERTKSYFFVGRPQKWYAYLEIYSSVGSFQVGEQIYVSGPGITLETSTFRAKIEEVNENSLLLSSVFPNITAQPNLGSNILGNTSGATAKSAVYRYATDEIPLKPADSQEEMTSVYDDIIALKRITSDFVRPVVKRYNWNPTVNSKFDMWKPDYSYAKPADVLAGNGATGAQNISSARLYVMNDNYEVFKCLYNGTSIANPTGDTVSLQPKKNVAPSGEGSYDSETGIFTEYPTVPSNGYVWKYMYTIPTNDVIRFVSTDFMPIVESAEVKALAANQNGSITTLLLRDAGSNLPTSATLYAEIVGDGEEGLVRIETTSQGSIEDVYLCDTNGDRVNISGFGYTYASIILKNGFLFSDTDLSTPVVVSSDASGFVEAIIPFAGGHGSDPVTEFFAKRVMANIRLTYSEGSGDFPVDNDFRRIGIITDPKLPAPSTEFATVDTLSGLYALKLNDVTTPFVQDEIIQQEVEEGKYAYGTVVSWVWDEVPAGQTPSSGVLKYFQSFDYHSDKGVVREFVSDAAKQVEAATSLSTGVIDTTYNTDSGQPLLGKSFENGLATPEIAKYTGNIIYIENRRLITRAPDQIEDIKLVIEF